MNSKFGLGKGIVVICLGLFLVSCATSMKKGEIWLESQKDKPEINISGKWISPEWGEATFKQEGREITGTLGDYPAKGVVSGSGLYLLMYSGNTVDYYAELKAANKDAFEGIYSKWFTIDELKKMDPKSLKPLNLKRVSTSP
jgi:hypothetical protein